MSHEAAAADARLDWVTVSGAVPDGWSCRAVSADFAFSDLLAAIDIAGRGYAVPAVVHEKWAAAVADLKDFPALPETFMPHGRARASVNALYLRAPRER